MATCEVCHNFVRSPILLPCSSKNICKEHLKSNTNDYQAIEITCPLCKKQHLIPDDGFPANTDLKAIMEQNEHLHEDEKRINLSFESSLENLKKLNDNLKNKQTELKKHVLESLAKIKEQINLDVKSAKSQIDKEGNKLFDQIKKFEIEKLSDERLIYKPNQTQLLLLGKLEVKSKQTQVQKFKVITGVDKDLKVWDMHKAACIKDIIGHQSTILSLTHSQIGTLISGSSDGTIKFWDMNADYSFIKSIKEPNVAVSSLAMSETNDLISGFSDGTIKVWDLSTWKCVKVLKKHTKDVVVLVPLPNNELISCSSSIHIWNISTSQCLHSFINDSMVFCIAITEERLVISGSEDGMIRVWSVLAKGKIRDLTGHEGCILSLEIKNDLLCSGDAEGIIRLWNPRTWKCFWVLDKHGSKISLLRLVDNNQLISCSVDCTVLVWNLNTYECISTLKRNEAAIQCSTLITDQ